MDLFSISPQNCVYALMFFFALTKDLREYKDFGTLLKQIEFLIHLLPPTSDCSHNPLFWLYALLDIDTVRIIFKPVLILTSFNVSKTCVMQIKLTALWISNRLQKATFLEF